MAKIKKGEHAPLNVTQEARHRVFVGLGWDPKDDVTLMDKAKELVGGVKAHHDLDLLCYLYTKNHTFIETIAGQGRNSTQGGKIYHSGDNIEGLGEGDDEQVSAELKDLDEDIHHIIFTRPSKAGIHLAISKPPKFGWQMGIATTIFCVLNLITPRARIKRGLYLCIFIALRMTHLRMVHG